MKKLLSLSAALILFKVLTAQVGTGPIELVKLNPGSFKAEDLELLKNSTTVFVYRQSDKDKMEQAKKALEGWTYSKIKLASLEEAAGLMNEENYSFFTIGGLNTDVTMSSGGGYSNTHFYLNLWMNKKTKKGKDDKISFCRVELQVSGGFVGSGKNQESETLKYLYGDCFISNWQWGFIKNYFQSVSGLLAAGKERWLYQGGNDKVEIKKLATEVLYVPEYIVKDFGKEGEKELFKDYPYKYKVLPATDLSKLILESDKPVYYLQYVLSSTDKYVYVFNGKTGNILYSDYSALSYNIKASDVKSVGKAAK